MTEDTETNGNPSIGFEQAKAILKVAYLLAATDGEICEREKAQFRELMKHLFEKRYAAIEVMTYLEDVSEEANKLIDLRSFYSKEDEIVQAFVSKASGPLSRIVTDPYVIRCAFAIWISICCADNDYSKIERMAVKEMQRLVNRKRSHNLSFVLGMPSANPVFDNIVNINRMLSGGLSKGKASKSHEITDRFLSDVEKRVKKIGELHMKMESATEADMKQNYKDMYDFELETLKEFLEVK